MILELILTSWPCGWWLCCCWWIGSSWDSWINLDDPGCSWINLDVPGWWGWWSWKILDPGGCCWIWFCTCTTLLLSLVKIWLAVDPVDPSSSVKLSPSSATISVLELSMPFSTFKAWVLDLQCLYKFLWVLKAMAQGWHGYGLSLVWVLICLSRTLGLVQEILQ